MTGVQTCALPIYALAILRNAKTLARALMDEGVKLVTDGTDNHLMVIDTVASFGLDGRAAEQALDRIGITTNKQIIPDDPRPPLRPSGVRLGTPACTTRGMTQDDMRRIARWIVSTGNELSRAFWIMLRNVAFDA